MALPRIVIAEAYPTLQALLAELLSVTLRSHSAAKEPPVCRFAVLALILLCVVCGGGATKPHQLVTIYARDPTSGQVSGPVSVWKQYQNKAAGVVGYVQDGDRVYLIRQVEGAALIQLPDQVQGWVSIDFIKELR